MANNKKSLQAKLLLSVSFIVILTMFFTAILGYSVEKKYLQNARATWFYLKTQGLATKVKNSIENISKEEIRGILNQAMQAEPEMIYISVVDDKDIIICDTSHQFQENREFNLATLQSVTPITLDEPESGLDDGLGFEVYFATLNRHFLTGTIIKARKNDLLFDAQWNIKTQGEKSLKLRIGFSAGAFQDILKRHAVDMLIMGFAVLIVTLAMMYLVIRKSLSPF